jgi:hypothetical protein
MYPAARLAFCPNTYKPPSSNDETTNKNSESCNGWTDLRRDLSIAAHDSGNSIYPMGSQKSIGRETDNCIFQCGIFHQSTRTSAMESSDLAQYQCTSLVNDQQNNRVKGKNFSKQIKTVDQRGCACRFQFVVKWDIKVCFYIELKQRSGHAFHVSHVVPMEITYMDTEDEY